MSVDTPKPYNMQFSKKWCSYIQMSYPLAYKLHMILDGKRQESPTWLHPSQNSLRAISGPGHVAQENATLLSWVIVNGSWPEDIYYDSGILENRTWRSSSRTLHSLSAELTHSVPLKAWGPPLGNHTLSFSRILRSPSGESHTEFS